MTADAPLLGYWTDFVDLARECSDLNIANGAIINLNASRSLARFQLFGAKTVATKPTVETDATNPGNTKRILAEI